VPEPATAITNPVRLTLLDGSTFVVCDQRGDVDGVSAASGFFAADTRFLSRSVLTIDGERGDHVLLAPPYIIDETGIDAIVERLGHAIDASLDTVAASA